MSNSRRNFMKMLPIVTIGAFTNQPSKSMDAEPTAAPYKKRQYQGQDLSGWETTLGDALYARPEDTPVSLNDIETIPLNTHSELRANIHRRIIMAHNITFKRFVDDQAFQFIHTCGYKFRLPYVPEEDEDSECNAQTIEGGLFVWDGGNTRLDYGIAFQWGINPWHEFGLVRTWTDNSPEGEWTNVGQLTPDTEWHEVKMVVDYQRETTTLQLDNDHYLTRFTGVTKPPTWGNETAARLQAEIVSIYPEPSGMQAMHKTEFKDWYWIWESHAKCNIFVPTVMK